MSTTPFRVPATPIWVHSPYVNWLIPADSPTDAWVWHVRNDKVGSITAALRIDGVAYSLLGPLHSVCPGGPLAMPALPLLAPAYILPTRTIFSYSGGGVVANLTLATPKFLEDLDSFVPLLLVDISVASVDGAVHKVQAFFEASGQLAVDADSTPVAWARDEPGGGLPPGTENMRIFNPTGIPLREYAPYHPANATGGQPTEHIDWGAAFLTTLPPLGTDDRDMGNMTLTTWMGSSNVARGRFARSGSVPADADESMMPLPACAGGTCRCAEGGRGAHNDWPSLTASWDLGSVGGAVVAGSKGATRARAMLSYDDLGQSARYFGQARTPSCRQHEVRREPIGAHHTPPAFRSGAA